LVAAAPAGAAFAFTERPRDESFRSPWRLRVWQADPQPDVAEIRLPAPCLALSFSPDGRHLVTLTADGRVASHRVPEGDTAELARIPLARGEGRVAALSADLRWLAYSRNGGRIAVADLTTGAELWSAEAAQEQLTSVAFAPDGSRLATGAGFTESTIRLWDVSSGQELARLEGHRTWVGALAFSADGTTLASASADQTIGLWDLANLSERSASEAVHGLTQVVHPKRILRGHQLEVWSLAWLRDGRRLASGAKDGTVLIWEPDRPLASPASQLVPGEFAAWSFEGDRPQLLTLERDGTVGRWTGEGLRQFTPLGHGLTNLFFPRFSGSGRFLVGSIAGGAIRVWSVAQQTAAREFRVAEGPLTPVAFLPGSDRLIARRWPQPEFQEWDCNTGQRLRTWRLAASPRLLAVRTVAVNGEWLAALNDDGTGQLLHLPTGRATDLRLDLKQITAATLSADGTLLAAVSRFGVGGLWEIPSAAPVATYSGVLQALVSATFSPDGRRLALGSDGAEAIKLWDLAGHQELLTLSAEGSGFATAAFSADGSLLAASNRDGRLRVWRAPTWDQIGRAESTAAQ
jgi:WD40 repeat protein